MIEMSIPIGAAFLIEIIKQIGAALLVGGLIFFILNNAFKTANYKRKGLIFLVVGMIFLLIFIGAHLFDRFYFELRFFSWQYYNFPVAILLYAFGIAIYYLIKGKKYHHHASTYKPQKTFKDQLYLYVLFKSGDYYYLTEKNRNLTGQISRFDKRVFFRDEAIQIFIQKMQMPSAQTKYIGSVTIQKEHLVFYCYEVTLPESYVRTDEWVSVHKLDMLHIDASEFHKNIILRMLIKEPFDIRL